MKTETRILRCPDCGAGYDLSQGGSATYCRKCNSTEVFVEGDKKRKLPKKWNEINDERTEIYKRISS